MAPRTRQSPNEENPSTLRRSSRLKKIEKSTTKTQKSELKSQATSTPSSLVESQKSKTLRNPKASKNSTKSTKGSKIDKKSINVKNSKFDISKDKNSTPKTLEIRYRSSTSVTTTKIQKIPSNAKEFEIIQKMQQEEQKLRQELHQLTRNYETERNYSQRVQVMETNRNVEFASRISYFKTHSRQYERIIRSWQEVENVLSNRVSDEDEDINFAERTLTRLERIMIWLEAEDDFNINEE